MAYDFGSDFLVDAMRAADPSRVADAKAKLEQISVQTVAKKQGAVAGKNVSEDFTSSLDRARQKFDTGDHRAKAAEKFEAVVLTTFVQEMMPDNASKVYGEGLAGDMWKSQLAEKIAAQIAKSGGIGIADQMLKDYQMKDDQKLPISGLSDPSQAVEKTRALDGASQFLKEIELDALLPDKKDGPPKLVIDPGVST